MKEYLAREHKTYASILEPSAGDGRFVDVLEDKEDILRIDAVELMEEKVRKLNEKNMGKKLILSGMIFWILR